jgi:hypothetical protein
MLLQPDREYLDNPFVVMHSTVSDKLYLRNARDNCKKRVKNDLVFMTLLFRYP